MIDHELVRAVRTSVSTRLAERDQQDEAAGRARLDAEAQRVLGGQVIQEEIELLMRRRFKEGLPALSAADEDELAQGVADYLFGLGPVERYLRDESIENIHAQGYDRVRLVRADGTREWGEPIASSDAEMVDILRVAAARSGRSERRFDSGRPMLNLRLPDGSRLFAAMEVTDRPVLSIRRHRYRKVSLADLVGLGTLTESQSRFFAAAVAARCNIVIGGGTNVGKTTFLRALLNELDPDERLVVVEDEAELDLSSAPELHHDVVEFEKRESNIEGQGEIGPADLVRAAQRMAPDRLIVGEARGEGEVFPLLLALSLGVDGSMSTVHAMSSLNVIEKLFLYAAMSRDTLSMEAIARLVAGSIDLVAHLSRLPDGSRVLSSVREVVGVDDQTVLTNEVLRPAEDGRAVSGAPMSESRLRRLRAAGFDDALLYGEVSRP